MRVHAGLRGETQAIHAVHEARADLVAVAQTAQRDRLAYAGHARHAEHCVRVFVKLLQNCGVQLRMGCGCVDGGWVDAGVEERCERGVVCVRDGGGVRRGGEIVRGKLVRTVRSRVRARGDAVFNQLHKAIDKTFVGLSARLNALARRQPLHGVAISALFHILTCIPRDADIDRDELRGDAAASDARVLARVERFEMDERLRCGGGGGEQEDGDGGCVEREVERGAVGCVGGDVCVDAVRGEAGDDLRGERGFGGGVRDEYCCLGVHFCCGGSGGGLWKGDGASWDVCVRGYMWRWGCGVGCRMCADRCLTVAMLVFVRCLCVRFGFGVRTRDESSDLGRPPMTKTTTATARGAKGRYAAVGCV